MRKILTSLLCFHLLCYGNCISQSSPSDSFYLLKADRLFDGDQMHSGWAVLIHKNRIDAVGEASTISVPVNCRVIEFKGGTLLPGLIEGHSHLFLHPYNETSWDDQVLKESRAERTARATVHARQTLLAGFTTVRDLGTEGAMYDDVGLRDAIEKGVIPGPRMIVATRAIVATGSYGPKVLGSDLPTPKGAAEADGEEGLIKEARTQIGKGAEVVKIYADYGWGPNHETEPTFTVEEMTKVVEVASSSGRTVAVHAGTAEGMRRAIQAGVTTIEHGDQGTAELFELMKSKKIALCPTVAAGEALLSYNGWKKGVDPEPERIRIKHASFQAALKSGVTICMGGDVGVFAHGDNAREMELMVEYGMQPLDVLRSATSVNADVFRYGSKIGRLKSGQWADIIAVDGDPSQHISDIRKTRLVMKNGIVYKLN